MKEECEKKISRAALHAEKIWLQQPFTQEEIVILAPVPRDMDRWLSFSQYVQ